MTPVEVAAVGAVISTTLNVVANKLAPPVIKWYSSVVGVEEDLHELLDLIKEINGWLETTKYEIMVNGQSFNWLKKLKEISHDVDDVVDEFQLEAEMSKQKSFKFRCKVASKIKKIKRRFDAIVKKRTDYSAITNSISVNPVQHTKMRTGDMSTWPNVDVTSVVGRDEDKDHIISKLEETDDHDKIKIISIIGLGGSGKTTLAKLVFNDVNIKRHFDVTLWIHVPQNFDVDNLVKRMFEAFADKNPGDHGVPYMRETISAKLTGKRFLLVMDDVRGNSESQWEVFREFLNDIGVPGSRILLTTRSSKVAKLEKLLYLFRLPLLSMASSWQLFLESYGTAENGLDPDFVKVGKEIVKKCGGVPLAIKVIAGVLREREMIEEWKAMRDNNLLAVDDEDHRVFECLWWSYFHFPPHLNQCFTLCSLIPKGDWIYKKQLIDQWIAHDMITLEDGVDHLEYKGNNYFDYLVQTSFLQDVEENDGIVRCRMHDLVHDFARYILGEEISFAVPMEETKSTIRYKYFILIDQPSIVPPKKVFEKARAVYVAASDNSIFGKGLKAARHLRSIMLEDILSASLPINLLQIKNLRYLSISHGELETLPDAISDVWNLQALHVTDCSKILELPRSIGKLQQLRTVNLSGCARLKCLPNSIGDCHMISSINLCKCCDLRVLPNTIGNLHKLIALNLSWCIRLQHLPDSIGDCEMISSIHLCNCCELTELPNSLVKLHKLRILNLLGCRSLKHVPDSIGDCEMISSIHLCYCSELRELPNSIGKLQKLTTLDLSRCVSLKYVPDSIGDCKMISSIHLADCCSLTELPTSFGKLHELRTLGLSGCSALNCLPDSIGDCKMISSIDLNGCSRLTQLPDSICRNDKLRVLRLGNTSVYQLPSSITTLRNLQCLDLQDCSQLVELPNGFSNLENLQVLNLEGCYKLVGMPIGIGDLNGLQKLGLFIVGRGEKFARISELANVSRIGEELTIRGISHVMDPGDAHKACLKQRKNLQRLVLIYAEEVKTNLNWMANDVEEVDAKVEQDVLDGLEPPPEIKELRTYRYSGKQYVRWMNNQARGGVQGPALFPFLRVMELIDFPNLKHLHGILELPCLEELNLQDMHCLESISGGPFPSLLKLKMCKLPCLREVWIVAERGVPGGEEGESCSHLGQIRVGNNVSDFIIFDCPKLKVKPYWPSSLQHLQLSRASEQLLQSLECCHGPSSSTSFSHLKKLQLWDVTGLGPGHGWELLQHMTALESLDIIGFSGVQTELPKSLWSLTSLRSVKVMCWSNIRVLPEWLWELRSLQELTIESCPCLTSLPQSMGQLTSLRLLSIGRCDVLHQLPDCLGELCSLCKLEIKNLSALTCLPQSMCRLTTSLQELKIYNCPGIKCWPQGMAEGLIFLEKLCICYCPGIQSLPEGIKGLTALKELQIYGCPDLVRRCEREKGEDWHLISHISGLWVCSSIW